MPVPRLVNVRCDACRRTGRIPVVFSIRFGGKLGSLRAQKQWNRLQIHLLVLRKQEVICKAIGMGIEANALLVKVALQKHDSIVVEADRLDPLPKTPFAERSRFRVGSEGCPVTDHEATDLGDASAGVKEQPGHDLVTLPGVLE